jgi:hypothetical protein
MKLFITGFMLIISHIVSAQSVEAPSLKEVLNALKINEFEFKTKGKVYGYEKAESCLFVAKDMAILKNYCDENESYAKGYTIFSKDFGVLELYEEKLGALLKRDFRILGFSSSLVRELNRDYSKTSLKQVSGIIEEIYENFYPGCWSTNFDKFTRTSDVKCSHGLSVNNFDIWASESQDIVFNDRDWSDIMESLEMPRRKKNE